MPQPSIFYACGRVGVLRKNALHMVQLERLMATHTYEEARRTLADIGFISGESTDYQAAADARVKNACELLEKVTPQPELTRCFQFRYDIHNLKVLLKSRFLAQKPQFLSACGTIPVEALRHAVTERRYTQLPPILAEALAKLEKDLARSFDPMLIDTELDKAMYRMIFERVEKFGSPVALKYFVAKVDLQNYIMLLRVKAMGKDAAFFEKLYLSGGSVSLKDFQRSFDDQDRLSKLLKGYGSKVVQTAALCAADSAKLPLMEKTADDYLYDLFHKTEAQSLERLIAYLLSAQREATDVRLVMAAKLNGFKQEDLMERVRELDG
ncbi:MAG: V-type ATPase subunit [Eubacteriales bacterium]|nr:V-type ATPase subunit [Eubacteriales bacterium]